MCYYTAIKGVQLKVMLYCQGTSDASPIRLHEKTWISFQMIYFNSNPMFDEDKNLDSYISNSVAFQANYKEFNLW